MSRVKDAEIAAMTAVSKALEALDEPTRARVLAWIDAKWGGNMVTVSLSERITREPLSPVGGSMLGTERHASPDGFVGESPSGRKDAKR